MWSWRYTGERRKGVWMKRPRRKTQRTSKRIGCGGEGGALGDTPSWASHLLNILKCQERKVLTALFLGHYSRLCWQQGTLRGEVLTPFRTKSSLANAQYESSGFPGLLVPQLWCKPTVCVVFIWVSASPLWPKVGQENLCKHDAHAPCCIVRKFFVSDPSISCLLLWNSSDFAISNRLSY